MITAPDTYFRDGCGRCERFQTDECSARHWAAALARLRALCLAAGLSEDVRWGHPCYRHAGRNLALLGATRHDVRLTLPDAELIDDPAGLLEPGGPNSAGRTVIRFADAAQVDARAPVLSAMLAQARTAAAAGRKPASRMAEAPDLPEDLAAALGADPALAAAFAALTPGRQRSHVLAIATAKAQATRLARIERLRPLILAGKGATER